MLKTNYIKLFLIFVTAFIPTILNRNDLFKKIVTFNEKFYLDLLIALFSAIILWDLNNRLNFYLILL